MQIIACYIVNFGYPERNAIGINMKIKALKFSCVLNVLFLQS